MIAVAHPVVAEDVTVVPEFLDDGGGVHLLGPIVNVFPDKRKLFSISWQAA